MLSDEEKKAIEIIKFLQDKCMQENGTGMMPIYRIDDLANAIKILINLIEKQSKEIEELKKYKEGYKLLSYSLDNYTSKDKIKAEIEELQEDIKYSANPLSIDNSKFGIKVLQSLLEKE